MGLCLRRLRLQYPLQGWQGSSGISGSFQAESVATFDWNRWQVSTGISGNLRAEYAPPTTVHEVRPERCACGHTAFALTTPYQTHQVIELPPIEMEVTHWVLHQGWWLGCGTWSKAPLPPEHATGYGPRFSALMGELAGTYGNGRRMVQTFCASLLRVPISF